MNKNLQQLSNEELLKERRTTRFMLGVFIGLILVMIAAGIISTLRKGVNVFTLVPIPFAILAFILFSGNYKKLNEEIKSRNLK